MPITIIGTSHISKESIIEIQEHVEKEQPDIVCLELDIRRAKTLLSKQKSKLGIREIFVLGVKGFIFAKLGQFVQEKLGNMVGVKPGSEMKAALLLARKHKAKIALIDQPIEKTLKNFSKQLSWRERFRFLYDISIGIFFRKKELERLGISEQELLNLREVPKEETIEKMIGAVKERYPNVWKTIIDDRNRYMVKRLLALEKKHPEEKILAVVGAGHKKEMERMLKEKQTK